MKIKTVIDLLKGKEFNVPDREKDLTIGYVGDFLSFVMGKAPENCVWFTVMNNINVVAVATLAGVGLVVMCEGVTPDEVALNKAKEEGVAIICTDYDAYSAIRVISGLTPQAL